MKALYRMITLFLSFAMLLSVCVFAAEAEAPLLGYYEGDVYVNEYFGLSFDGSGWDYEPQDELMAENGLSEPLADDTAARDYITDLGKNGDIYCDMTAYSADGMSMVVGYVEYMTAAERLSTPNEETYTDMVASSLAEDDTYESIEKLYGTFLGEEHPYIRMTAEGDLVIDQYYLYNGEFLFTALVASYDGEEGLAGMTALWSSSAGVEGTDAPPETPAETEADVSEYLGRIEGTAYINEYFGIGFDPGAEWTYASAEDLAQLSTDSADSLGTLMETDAQNLTPIYDMLATSPDGTKTVYVGIIPISASSQMIFQASKDNLASLMYSLSKDQFESMQGDGVSITSEVNTLEFLGEETDGLVFAMDMELDGGAKMSFQQQEVFRFNNNCILTIYLMTFTEDPQAVAEMADMFYELP